MHVYNDWESISIMNTQNCTGEENEQTIESTVLTSHIETMYIGDTLPAGTTPTETTLQDIEEAQNVDYYSVCTNCSK